VLKKNKMGRNHLRRQPGQEQTEQDT
jgi:hypothetical protein